MSENLVKEIARITASEESLISKNLTATKDSKLGDLALPCFIFAKALKLSPPEIAKKLAAELKLPADISKVEAVGPYLNFFLNRSTAAKNILSEIFSKKEDFGKKSEFADKTILVEYSSPNIAKPFHIGHLRTTIIGFALYNCFRQLGYKTVSINHLGDWGTQFGFVYAGCKFWGKPKQDSVEALVELYVDANLLRKNQEAGTVPEEHKSLPDANQTARDYFIRLENGDREATDFWKWCIDISLEYLKKLYARIGISFDSYLGESFYIPMFPKYAEDLKSRKIMTESRGAWGVDLGEKLGFARLLTEDGRSLYLTRDLITADYREQTYHPDKILLIVGAPQILHFKQLLGILEKINHPVAKKITHIPYGHVPGISTRKMKSDSDEDLSLSGLLDDAEERALQAYQTAVTKKPSEVDEAEVAKAVGLGAIFYNYLSRTNIKDFHFNWEEALNFQGDTGPYLQYALARLFSISEKAEQAGLKPNLEFSEDRLNDAEIYSLVNHLGKFPAILEKTSTDYEPNNIAQYSCDLAKMLSKNYKSMRVIGEADADTAQARLAVFEASKTVLSLCLKLLGIPALRKM